MAEGGGRCRGCSGKVRRSLVTVLFFVRVDEKVRWWVRKAFPAAETLGGESDRSGLVKWASDVAWSSDCKG
jgi:hypothetical protein